MVVRDIMYLGKDLKVERHEQTVRYYALENIHIREIKAVPLWQDKAKEQLMLKTTNLRKPVYFKFGRNANSVGVLLYLRINGRVRSSSLRRLRWAIRNIIGRDFDGSLEW